jgi:mannose-6-phosphate isomerase-like protein (cupin superfamily)
MRALRHQRAPELADMSLEAMMERYTKAFKDVLPDWKAFADSQIEGKRRAQHRLIGGGGSGKHDDPDVIPAGAFTLSVMFLPPGQGGSAHTHEVEEVFFVLTGVLTVFIEDEAGRRISKRIGPWECVCCPAGVPHGFLNEGVEGAYFQTLIGSGRPGAVGFTDSVIYRAEEEKLAAQQTKAT